MLIKVCGLRQPENARQVADLGVDMVGFIFYSRSPRYVSSLAPDTAPNIARVGVFVDECEEQIRETAHLNNLTHIQLHGDESAAMCLRLRPQWQIIKAISIATADDFAQASNYDRVCDILLFDTKSEQRGGSGELFDWSLLEHYHGDTPFLLSGGISPHEAQRIRDITHPKLLGIDLNSRFESQPAIKNIELLDQFIKNIRQ